MSFAVFLLYVVCNFLRPIELLAPGLAELRPMFWLWLLAFMMALGRSVSRREFAARGVHMALLGSFTVILALSQVANGWAGGAMQAVSQFSTSALLFVLVCMNVTTVQRLRSTCIALAVTMVFAACVSIYSYHSGYRADELVLRQGGFSGERGDGSTPDESTVPAQDQSGLFMWRVRWLGFLNDPNDFAQIMVATLPLLWAVWIPGRRWRMLALQLLPSAALLYSIYLTQSRGALLGVGAVFAMWLQGRLGRVKSMIMVGTLGLLAIAASMGGERAISSKEGSAGERIEAWSTGLIMFKSHPLFGVGFGNFTEHHELTAHNSFVLCFSETGLLGFFTWMGMLVIAFKGMSLVLQRLPADTEEHRLARLLRLALVGFLACAWFLSRTYQSTLFFLLGLCVAVWHCAGHRLQPAGDLALQGWAGTTWKAMLVTVLAVFTFVRIHYAGG